MLIWPKSIFWGSLSVLTNSVIILVGFVLSLSRVLIAMALKLLYQHDGLSSAYSRISWVLECLWNTDSAAHWYLALYWRTLRVVEYLMLQHFITQSYVHTCIFSGMLLVPINNWEEVCEEATKKINLQPPDCKRFTLFSGSKAII